MNSEKNEPPAEIPTSNGLAGLTRRTVYSLKWSEDQYMIYDHAGPHENGKYSGWILTLEGRPVVNSEPIFDTAEEAEAHMRKVVQMAREYEEPANA